MRNVRSAVVVSCVMGLTLVTPARSQTFSGRVTDGAGHAIPGAEARLASMDTRAVATAPARADGSFSVTAPRTMRGLRRYYAELCAPGFAPNVEVVPLARGDSLVVRANLIKATSRAVPVGSGACAWQGGGPRMVILGGRGFGTTAILTERLRDSLDSSFPDDRATRASVLHRDELTWLHAMDSARSAASRERAAWMLLGLLGIEDTADVTLESRVRAALPPTSRWWQVGNVIDLLAPVQTLFNANLRDTAEATLAARRAARDYISRISSAKHDPDVNASAEAMLALYDFGLRDTASVTRRAKTLIAEYPGYNAAKLTMFRFRWVTPLRDGAPMPHFDFATLPGAAQPRLANRDLTAPYTLLTFWGTWCVHCIEELPTLDSLHAEFHGRGLDIVSIAADDSPDVASRFVHTHDMPWRQAYAGTTQDPFLLRIGVFLFPTSLLVDSSGTIVASNATSAGLRQMVEKYLNR